MVSGNFIELIQQSIDPAEVAAEQRRHDHREQRALLVEAVPVTPRVLERLTAGSLGRIQLAGEHVTDRGVIEVMTRQSVVAEPVKRPVCYARGVLSFVEMLFLPGSMALAVEQERLNVRETVRTCHLLGSLGRALFRVTPAPARALNQ